MQWCHGLAMGVHAWLLLVRRFFFVALQAFHGVPSFPSPAPRILPQARMKCKRLPDHAQPTERETPSLIRSC